MSAPRIRIPVGAILLVAVLLAISGFALHRGYDFYRLSLDARVDHDDFRILSPGEFIGHGYGVVGTALMFTNLLYVVRRKLARFPLGSMRFWLDLHVVTGLVGALLVVFHSAFQLRTPIATITSLSLFLVVITGIVGRYLYALSPKLDDSLFESDVSLLEKRRAGWETSIRDAMRAEFTNLPANASLLRALLTVPTWLRERSERRQAVFEASAPFLEANSDAKAVAQRVAEHAADEVRVAAASALLRTWRGMHRLFAILMLLAVAVHIGVAWFYGYRWIFSAE